MCVYNHVMSETELRMASHIVRWWKSKFLTGYKQFTAVLTADCGDLRTSDTEELLKSQDHPAPACTPPLLHANSAPSPPPSPTPTPQPQPETQPQARRELNFEGFECDVSLEGNGDSKDRQEFSFTLYDFDGHGKITKDDIAGLVTTIYDTLGSSIRVPHYGSKTIKVKLTVSPDPPNSTSAPTPADTTPQQQPRRYKRDLNVTIRERRGRPGGGRRPQRRHSISSSAASEDREADISEEEEEPHPHPAPPPPYSRLAPNLHIPSCRMPSSLHSRSKKRSSSLQRQELLQIIQANMEKNNLCFKTSRKHYSPGQDVRHKSPQQQCWERGRGRGKSQEVPVPPTVPPVPPRPCPPPPTTNTSPHYLKHRHREQEQARAMDQVVRWLEQEFSSPHNRGSRHHKCTTEHHHVHEHVHHHYHHYQESPVLV